MPSSHHHNEWLSLIEVSGPFLSVPVLERAFPHGLDAHDSDHAPLLKLAFEEWEDNQQGERPSPAIHREWINFVLKQTLGLPDEVLIEGQAIPQTPRATIAEHGETLRPDLVVQNPGGVPSAGKARLLIQIYPPTQDLEKPIPGRHRSEENPQGAGRRIQARRHPGGGGVQQEVIMKSPKDRAPLFERLRTGLEEAIRHAKGEISLKATVLELPDPPPQIQPDELMKLRLDSRMSQDVFARVLNVPTKTVQNWEEGTRKPTQAALRLIQVFRQNPSGVLQVVGMADSQAPASPRKRTPRIRSKRRTPPDVMP
jgi:DNA-binding transcriptional regulator YiaG